MDIIEQYKNIEEYFCQGVGNRFPFDQFETYLHLLLKWNEKLNLTSLSEPKRIIDELIIDSLFLVPYIEDSKSILDIGAGAGFPSIPLKIASKDKQFTLCDSIKKRTDFLKEVVRQLGLRDMTVLKKTVTPDEPVGIFDTIVSRGTMTIDRFINIAFQNLKPGGKILLPKGAEVHAEIDAAMPEIEKNKMTVTVHAYTLPYSKRRRAIVVIR